MNHDMRRALLSIQRLLAPLVGSPHINVSAHACSEVGDPKIYLSYRQATVGSLRSKAKVRVRTGQVTHKS